MFAKYIPKTRLNAHFSWGVRVKNYKMTDPNWIIGHRNLSVKQINHQFWHLMYQCKSLFHMLLVISPIEVEYKFFRWSWILHSDSLMASPLVHFIILIPILKKIYRPNHIPTKYLSKIQHNRSNSRHLASLNAYMVLSKMRTKEAFYDGMREPYIFVNKL